MNFEGLTNELQRFLRSRTAERLCERYQIDPAEAMGALFLRLRDQQSRSAIQNWGGWFRASAKGHLQNYLRTECSQLNQGTE